MTDNNATMASWDDLAAVESASTAVIDLPILSAKLGRPLQAKIRAITIMELVKAIDFPMDEMNRLVAESKSGEDWTKAAHEHIETLDVQQLMKVMENTIAIGLISPDPKAGDIRKLEPDWGTIFTEICKLTSPPEALQQGAAFRTDG